MKEVYIRATDTVEVILSDAEVFTSVRVTGTGQLFVNTDDGEQERGYFAQIQDIVKTPEELEP